MDNNDKKSHVKVEINTLMEYCRLCMARGCDFNDINQKKSTSIADEIQFCTGITVFKDDGLPTKICDSCINSLSLSYKFKSSCLFADETFRRVIKENIKSELSDVDNVYIIKCESNGDDSDIKAENDYDFPLEVVEDKPLKSRKHIGRPLKSEPRRQRKVAKYRFKKLYCEPCDIRFTTRPESEQHRKEVHGNDKWICEVCGKQFVHRSSHYAHVRSHMPPQHHCEHCGYSTCHKPDLVKHVRTHTGSKIYQCEFCTARFYTSSNLRSHIRRGHEAGRPHACHSCGAAFVDKDKLQRHLDTHNEVKRFACELCNGSFSRRYHWRAHLLRHHDILVPQQKPGRQKSNFIVGAD